MRRRGTATIFACLSAVHPKHGIPHRSLVALGLVAAGFCFFSLQQVITMLVVTRILLQFFLQQVGVMVLRVQRPELERPFRIPLYPLPPAGRDGGIRLHPGEQESRARRTGGSRRHCCFGDTDLRSAGEEVGAVALWGRVALIPRPILCK